MDSVSTNRAAIRTADNENTCFTAILACMADCARLLNTKRQSIKKSAMISCENHFLLIISDNVFHIKFSYLKATIILDLKPVSYKQIHEIYIFQGHKQILFSQRIPYNIKIYYFHMQHVTNKC